MKFIDIIRETNGDILGIFLFLFLIIYFHIKDYITDKDSKTVIEILLLISCYIAFFVDMVISFKILRK